jgi:hypothetical protein
MIFGKGADWQLYRPRNELERPPANADAARSRRTEMTSGIKLNEL